MARSELKLEEALARFEARAQQQVKEWFETHTDLEERTFMLSLAVLNGANYQAVVEADERLQSLIKPPSAEDEPLILIYQETARPARPARRGRGGVRAEDERRGGGGGGCRRRRGQPQGHIDLETRAEKGGHRQGDPG